jgi:hypothetical protein
MNQEGLTGRVPSYLSKGLWDRTCYSERSASRPFLGARARSGSITSLQALYS